MTSAEESDLPVYINNLLMDQSDNSEPKKTGEKLNKLLSNKPLLLLTSLSNLSLMEMI